MASIISTFNPPTIGPEADLDIDNFPPTVHEIECISKIRKLLLPIRHSIQNALVQLNSWRPDWADHRDRLQETYGDAERTLFHMQIDYNQEKERFERATGEVEYLQGSLPIDDYAGSGNRSPDTDSQHIAYRKKRMHDLQFDAESHAWRLAELQQDMTKREELLQTIRVDRNPSCMVMERFKSIYSAFSEMDSMLDTEYAGLTRRVKTPLQRIPDEIWREIFHYAIQMQEMDNEEILTKGMSHASIRCPTRLATGLALVCKRWKNILPHEGHRVLGDSWVIDLPTPESIVPSISARIVSASVPIRVTLAKGISSSSGIIHELSTQLATLNLSHLGVVYFRGSDFNNLLKSSATRGNLKSLSIYGESQTHTPQFIIPGSVLQRLIRMEIIDCEIKPLFFQVPGNNLRSLRLILNQSPPFANRMSSLNMYSLLAPLRQLEELDLDLGFEDSPMFSDVQYPNVPEFPSRLRTLRTRFTYFQNRLAFLRHSDIRLPELDSIRLITIPSFSYNEKWDNMNKIFTETSLAQTVTKLAVESILPTRLPRPPCPAAIITTNLPKLERMELHGESVTHFLEHVCSNVKDPENASSLTSLQELHIRDSTTSGDEILKFVRLFCGESMDTPPLSSEGIQLRGSRLRIVETYRCSGVSVDTLKRITEMLPRRLLNT